MRYNRYQSHPTLTSWIYSFFNRTLVIDDCEVDYLLEDTCYHLISSDLKQVEVK